MRNLQKPTMILLMICLVMAMLISPASNVQAAKKKIKLSKKFYRDTEDNCFEGNIKTSNIKAGNTNKRHKGSNTDPDDKGGKECGRCNSLEKDN